MKIPKITMPAVNPYRSQEQRVQQTTGRYSFNDRLEISSEAIQLLGASAYTAARHDKVDALKQQIAAGTYQVNPEQIAKKVAAYYNGQ